jgi:hypothetical protein
VETPTPEAVKLGSDFILGQAQLARELELWGYATWIWAAVGVLLVAWRGSIFVRSKK